MLDIEFLFEVGRLELSSSRKRSRSPAAMVGVETGVEVSQACLQIVVLTDSGGASWRLYRSVICVYCAGAASTERCIKMS